MRACLILPKQRTIACGLLEFHPRRVAHWIESLPLADLTGSATQLRDYLVQVNHVPMTFGRRKKLLERFASSIQEISKRLDKQLREVAYPSTPYFGELVRLARSLHLEMTMGYQLLLAHRVNHPHELRQRNPWLSILYDAIHHQAAVLYYQWLIRLTPSAGQWQALHSLYWLAEQAGHNELCVADRNANVLGKPCALRDLYVTILLLSLAQPTRLTPRELIEVARVSQQWANEPSLARVGPDSPSSTGFVVDLASDQAPYPLSSQGGAYLRSELRTLGLQPILHRIRSELLSNTIRAVTWDTLGRGRHRLLRNLYLVWSGKRRRRSTRHKTDFSVVLHMGFPATLEFTSHWKNQTVAWETQIRNELDWLEKHLSNLPDMESFALGTLDRQRIETTAQVEEEEKRSFDSCQGDAGYCSLPPAHARTLDKSACGFRIRWEQSNLLEPRVGELSGLQKTKDGTALGVGVIRWVEADGDTFSVGVELLARRAAAGTVCTSKHTSKPLDVLFLPAEPINGSPKSIILPSNTFQAGQNVQATFEGEHREIRLSRLLEYADSYNLFAYTELWEHA